MSTHHKVKTESCRGNVKFHVYYQRDPPSCLLLSRPVSKDLTLGRKGVVMELSTYYCKLTLIIVIKFNNLLWELMLDLHGFSCFKWNSLLYTMSDISMLFVLLGFYGALYCHDGAIKSFI